jgi:DNA polymerase-3 subunit delta
MAATKTAKSATLSALDFLAQAGPDPARSPLATQAAQTLWPLCAVVGDDAYLKSAVLVALRRVVLGSDSGEFALTTLAGSDTKFRDVLDALATVSLFGGERRLVVVEEADSFVTEFRRDIEAYLQRPFRGGLLVLDVKSWPANTILAKAVAATGLAIDCKSPSEAQAKAWICRHASAEFDVRLDAGAADALLELLPLEIGVLAQEVAKLALLAGERRLIDVALVNENVGGWRTRTAWEMIDAAADGRAAVALAQLDRLISAGEKPQGLLPQMGATLRRFATATRQIEAAEKLKQKLALRDALSKAGVPPFKQSQAERQLRRIGRRRALQLTDWVLSADLAMKGHNSSDDRARSELECLIVRLAGADQPAAAVRPGESTSIGRGRPAR